MNKRRPKEVNVTPTVKGYYHQGYSNKKKNKDDLSKHANKHGLKTVIIVAAILMVAVVGYHIISGGNVNPFETASTSQPSRSATSQSSSSSDNNSAEMNLTMATSVMHNVCTGVNNFANGYGDRNNLAGFFVGGKNNAYYQQQVKWAKYELGNYNVRSANVAADKIHVNKNVVDYRLTTYYVFPKGNQKRLINHYKAVVKEIDGQFKVIKLLQQ